MYEFVRLSICESNDFVSCLARVGVLQAQASAEIGRARHFPIQQPWMYPEKTHIRCLQANTAPESLLLLKLIGVSQFINRYVPVP